jgi:periplasmic protein TonB
MKLGLFLGIGAAVVLHAGFLTFGGLIFHAPKEKSTPQEVELLSSDDVAPEEKKKEDVKPPDATEELKAETEQAPDAEELIRHMELSAASQAPALDAASLGAIEDALNGTAAAAGDFAQSLDFASGGRIGGVGKAGALETDTIERAFSLDELDQKPHATFQPAPNYPAALRGRKIEGVVSVFFLLDATGKVSNPRVEKSSNAAFEKPAIDAVKSWKFEPGIKAGKRVPSPMRVQIRFQPS